MSDSAVDLLLKEAARTPDKSIRLSCLMEAALRPGLWKFIKDHVLVHGGPQLGELPDVYMGVFAHLTAEMIESYMANTGEDTGAREALRNFCKQRFAAQLEWTATANFTPVGDAQRPDA